MKLQNFAFLLFLFPIDATAQSQNPLSQCDRLDKFQKMDCLEKFESAVKKRMSVLEKNVLSGLSVLDNQFRNMRWPDGAEVRFSKEFQDAQRIWKEFTEKDCRAETAVSFGGSGWGSIMQECMIKRYLLRERTLQQRSKDLSISNLVEIFAQCIYDRTINSLIQDPLTLIYLTLFLKIDHQILKLFP